MSHPLPKQSLDGRRRADRRLAMLVVGLVLSQVVASGVRAGEPMAGLTFDPAAGLEHSLMSFSLDDQHDDAVKPAPGDGDTRDAFRTGATMATVYGSAIFGDSGKGEMYLAHVGVHRFVEDDQSLGLELCGGYVRSGIDDDGGAIGFDVVYRNHFQHDDDAGRSVYFNAGLGLQQASTNFSGRRHLNFRMRIGFGATFAIDERATAVIGADYIHISDAGIEGGGGGFDGPMLYAGLSFPF